MDNQKQDEKIEYEVLTVKNFQQESNAEGKKDPKILFRKISIILLSITYFVFTFVTIAFILLLMAMAQMHYIPTVGIFYYSTVSLFAIFGSITLVQNRKYVINKSSKVFGVFLLKMFTLLFALLYFFMNGETYFE